MAQTETLTSLAMLKVNIDHQKDYLEYLLPFVRQVLTDNSMDPVNIQDICTLLRSQFGLEIPARTVEIVLNRLCHRGELVRNYHLLHITEKLKDPGIAPKKNEATRHINAVIEGLLEFGKVKGVLFSSRDDVVDSICAFLSEFNIPCLRAFIRGTAIPNIGRQEPVRNVLISEYVIHLQEREPERFKSFMVLVQGHMLANALICPDLLKAPKTFKGVTFYLDTPLLIRSLGFDGAPKGEAIVALSGLLRNLDAKVSAFSHSRDEVCNVLKSASVSFDDPTSLSPMLQEAHRCGITKSDFLLSIGNLDEALKEASINIEVTPEYVEEYQIDENVFEAAMTQQGAFYKNERAKLHDINSVRSIYVLRGKHSPENLETCVAIMVTSNSAFAHAAYAYGMNYAATREVSSVMTDFGVANLAWLKTPLGAPSIPRTELLAYAYAALRASKVFMERYLDEIEKLLKRKSITPRDHQILRSWVAEDEMMRITLGDEREVNEDNISEALARVTSEIKGEESRRLLEEKKKHDETRQLLTSAINDQEELQKLMYWKLSKRAKFLSSSIMILIAGLVFLGLFESVRAVFGLNVGHGFWAAVIGIGVIAFGIFSILHFYYGLTLQDVREKLRGRILDFMVSRDAKRLKQGFSQETQ